MMIYMSEVDNQKIDTVSTESKVETSSIDEKPKVETITSDKKPKNPNRVEWGRKLAKLSQESKARKKAGKQVSKKLESIKETTEQDLEIDKSSNNYLLYIGIGTLFVGSLGVYYQWKSYKVESIPEVTTTLVKETKIFDDMME